MGRLDFKVLGHHRRRALRHAVVPVTVAISFMAVL